MGNAESGPAATPAPEGRSNLGTGEEDWDYGMQSSVEASTDVSSINNNSLESQSQFSKDDVKKNMEEEPKANERPQAKKKILDMPGLENDNDVLSALMDDDAAVFDFLANAKSQNSENASVTDGPSAVFDRLQSQSSHGGNNNHKSPRSDTGDAVSVRDQPSAIFDVLERVASNEAMDATHRSSGHVMQWLETTNGNNDGASVVSEMSNGVLIGGMSSGRHHVKAYNNEDDDESVSKYSSSEVFKMLSSNDNDDESMSGDSAAIFKVLDSTPAPDVIMSKPRTVRTGRRGGRFSGAQSVDLTYLAHSQKSLKKKNIFHILNAKQHGHITESIPEDEEFEAREPSREALVQNLEEREGASKPSTGQKKKNAFPQVVHTDFSDVSSTESELTEMPQRVFSEVIDADSYEEEPEDEIDLEFVENFDKVFDEFVGKHPKFLMKYPELVHQLRVTKLHKTLKHQEETQKQLVEELSAAVTEKQRMEITCQWKLKEASRKKAGQQIQLQNELTSTYQRTKLRKVDLMNRILTAAENRGKFEFHHDQHVKAKKASFSGSTGIANRDEVVNLLPSATHDDSALMVRKALLGTLPNYGTEKGKMDEIRKCQVRNAFMMSEIAVLQQKLEAKEGEMKKHTWIDSVMLRMNKATMAKLQHKYQAKLGLTGV